MPYPGMEDVELNGSGIPGDRSMLIKPTKNMKKVIYVLFLPLVVVSGLVFANREIKNETSKKSTPRLLSAAEMKAAKKNWEATPDGINFNKWKASPEGQKVLASAAKIRNHIKIIIRGHSVSYAPKYSYPIVSGDYVERDSKIIYKAPPRKGGC